MIYNHFNYAEMLARRLKAISHTDKDCHFFRATEQTELRELEDNITAAKGTILIAIDGVNSNFSWNLSDSLMERPMYSLVIARQTSSTDSETVFAAQKQCKEIALQCIAKLLQDAEKDVRGCMFIDEGSFSIDGFGPIADMFYGVIVSYSFTQGLNYMIDSAMWNETDKWDTLKI